MKDTIESILSELQRRKDEREDECDSCHGTGRFGHKVCVDCLGQGVLLTGVEYDLLLTYAYRINDRILEEEFLD